MKLNKNIRKAQDLVKAKAEKNKFGSIICPSCNNTLYYEVYKNGHIWGKCKTFECLHWVN
jgi:hypothetical protein